LITFTTGGYCLKNKKLKEAFSLRNGAGVEEMWGRIFIYSFKVLFHTI
jgi:hypothetical protein